MRRHHCFLNHPATSLYYTLSLHDALPILWYSYKGADYRIGYAESKDGLRWKRLDEKAGIDVSPGGFDSVMQERSEEHTSELQSHVNLVCRLLLEKKKSKKLHLLVAALGLF